MARWFISRSRVIPAEGLIAALIMGMAFSGAGCASLSGLHGNEGASAQGSALVGFVNPVSLVVEDNRLYFNAEARLLNPANRKAGYISDDKRISFQVAFSDQANGTQQVVPLEMDGGHTRGECEGVPFAALTDWGSFKFKNEKCSFDIGNFGPGEYEIAVQRFTETRRTTGSSSSIWESVGQPEVITVEKVKLVNLPRISGEPELDVDPNYRHGQAFLSYSSRFEEYFAAIGLNIGAFRPKVHMAIVLAKDGKLTEKYKAYTTSFSSQAFGPALYLDWPVVEEVYGVMFLGSLKDPARYQILLYLDKKLAKVYTFDVSASGSISGFSRPLAPDAGLLSAGEQIAPSLLGEADAAIGNIFAESEQSDPSLLDHIAISNEPLFCILMEDPKARKIQEEIERLAEAEDGMAVSGAGYMEEAEKTVKESDKVKLTKKGENSYGSAKQVREKAESLKASLRKKSEKKKKGCAAKILEGIPFIGG